MNETAGEPERTVTEVNEGQDFQANVVNQSCNQLRKGRIRYP